MEFRTPKGAKLTTDHPLLKASLLVLGEAWPRRLPFRVVLERSAQLSGGAREPSAAQALADLWVRGYEQNVIRLHAYAPPAAARAGERPCTSALARLQLALGREAVTNLDHEPVRLDDRHRPPPRAARRNADRAALAGELGAAWRPRQIDDDLDRLAALALLEDVREP